MIAKEVDSYKSQHDYEQAGQSALERLGYYLKREFSEQNSNKAYRRYGIRVFNLLRFNNGNYALQIDHLIMHRSGFILIENRSEPADIEVNIMGEWTQKFQGAELRISSPISQGERKANFLMSLLEQNSSLLRPLKKGLGFQNFPVALIIAIPEEGHFVAPPGAPIPQAHRAHLIPERVISIIEQQQKAARHRLGLARRPEKTLDDEEIFKITAFLRKQHNPRDIQAPMQSRSAKQPPVKPKDHDIYSCSNCGSGHLRMDHNGQYQLQCADCGALMDIERSCAKCSKQTYIRRHHNEYYLECEACQSSSLFFVETASVA